MEVGRRIYYDRETGNVIADSGEMNGDVVGTTIAQDFERFKALSDLNPASVGVLELTYGQYAGDFLMCSGYRIDTETREIIFSYPDPGAPNTPPVYRPPLSIEVADLKQRTEDLEIMLADMITGGM